MAIDTLTPIPPRDDVERQFQAWCAAVDKEIATHEADLPPHLLGDTRAAYFDYYANGYTPADAVASEIDYWTHEV